MHLGDIKRLLHKKNMGTEGHTWKAIYIKKYIHKVKYP